MAAPSFEAAILADKRRRQLWPKIGVMPATTGSTSAFADVQEPGYFGPQCLRY